MDDLDQIIQTHGEQNVLGFIQRQSAIDADMFVNGIHKEAKKVIVHAFMRSGEADEAFIQIQYGVEVSIVKEDESIQPMSQFIISEMGDGGIVSDFAVRRRQNTVFLTKSIADYIKLEIERGHLRSSNKVVVTRTDEWMDIFLTTGEEL